MTISRGIERQKDRVLQPETGSEQAISCTNEQQHDTKATAACARRHTYFVCLGAFGTIEI
jgi:hypothetical protein